MQDKRRLLAGRPTVKGHIARMVETKTKLNDGWIILFVEENFAGFKEGGFPRISKGTDRSTPDFGEV